MAMIEGFPPIEPAQARLLVLGSMPGIASLQAVEYYAHPRNSFWFIIERLFSDQTGLGYTQRTALLRQQGIALWDVLGACERAGSLDSAIVDQTLQPNDFGALFQRQPGIAAVLFNGTRAERDYRRHVLPQLPPMAVSYHRMVSTSPAMASMTPQQKLQQWRLLVELLQQEADVP